MKKINVSLFLTIFLVGCSVGPDFKKPLPNIPEGWYNYNIDIHEPAVTWWNKLEDKTLNQLIWRGIFFNWDIKQAQAKIKQARAVSDQAKALFWPVINLSGGASRQHISQGFPIATVSTNFTFYEQNFMGIWDLDVWGGKRRGAEAARAYAKMRLEDRRAVMIIVIAEIAKNYCELRVIQKQTNILKRQKSIAIDNLSLCESLLIQNMIDQQQIDEAKALIHNIASKIEAIKSYEAQIYMSLSTLTSLWTKELHEILAHDAPIPNPKDFEASAGLPSTLLCRRPDVRSAVQKIRAANAEIGMAKADFFPKFEFFSFFGYLSTQWLSLFNQANQNTIWGGHYLLPLFNGGLLNANLKESIAKRDEMMADYLGTVLNALAQVDAAIAMKNSEKQKFEDIEAISQRKLSIFQANQAIYEQEMISLIDVNQSELEYLNSQLKSLEAQNDWLNSWITFYKALGGGWQWDECTKY